MSNDNYEIYVVIPGIQEHHTRMCSKLYMWSTKTLVTNRADDWRLKTKQIATLAADQNRGAVLGNDLVGLEALCVKYGGVIQDIRTGEVLAMSRNGWAFENWAATSKPFYYDDLTLVSGYAVVDGRSVRNEYKTNGRVSLNYIRNITDAPEVIELLGRETYIP